MKVEKRPHDNDKDESNRSEGAAAYVEGKEDFDDDSNSGNKRVIFGGRV